MRKAIDFSTNTEGFVDIGDAEKAFKKGQPTKMYQNKSEKDKFEWIEEKDLGIENEEKKSLLSSNKRDLKKLQDEIEHIEKIIERSNRKTPVMYQGEFASKTLRELKKEKIKQEKILEDIEENKTAYPDFISWSWLNENKKKETPKKEEKSNIFKTFREGENVLVIKQSVEEKIKEITELVKSGELKVDEVRELSGLVDKIRESSFSFILDEGQEKRVLDISLKEVNQE